MQFVIAVGQPAKGHRGCTEIGVYSRFSQPDSRGSSQVMTISRGSELVFDSCVRCSPASSLGPVQLTRRDACRH
jgi:hypothetical protein